MSASALTVFRDESTDTTSRMKESELKLLLVEDNPLDTNLLRDRLEAYGRPFSLEVVTDADAASEFFNTRIESHSKTLPVCLVILDLNLPKRSGFDFLKEIKQDPRTKSLPVLVLTTSQQPSDIIGSYSLYADAFMTKPMTLDGYNPIIDVITTLHDQYAEHSRS